MKMIFILPIFLGSFYSSPILKWSKDVKNAYMNSCIESAETAMSKRKAKKYCACTMKKVEMLYPDANKLGEISKETIERIAKECLGL